MRQQELDEGEQNRRRDHVGPEPVLSNNSNGRNYKSMNNFDVTSDPFTIEVRRFSGEAHIGPCVRVV